MEFFPAFGSSRSVARISIMEVSAGEFSGTWPKKQLSVAHRKTGALSLISCTSTRTSANPVRPAPFSSVASTRNCQAKRTSRSKRRWAKILPFISSMVNSLPAPCPCREYRTARWSASWSGSVAETCVKNRWEKTDMHIRIQHTCHRTNKAIKS